MSILLMVGIMLAMVAVVGAISTPSPEDVGPTPRELGLVDNPLPAAIHDVTDVELPKYPTSTPSSPPGLAEEKLLYSLAERVAKMEENMTLLQQQQNVTLLQGKVISLEQENAALRTDVDCLKRWICSLDARLKAWERYSFELLDEPVEPGAIISEECALCHSSFYFMLC